MLLLLLLASFSFAQATETATLTWDDPPSEERAHIAGYRLHYGTSSGTYSTTMDVGNTISATMPNLTVGITYYCVVTAYNTAGLESAPSDEVSFTVGAQSRPVRPPPPLEISTADPRPARPPPPPGSVPSTEASFTIPSNQLSAAISAMQRLSDGSVNLMLTSAVSAVPGVNIYVSSDLKTWTLLTKIANPTGTLVVTDPDAAFVNQRFYRVLTE